MNVADHEIKDLLLQHRKFSVYGLSPSVEKPSHYVPLYMRDRGWDMVGVYPRAHDQSGFKIHKALSEVPAEYRKFVNVFRRSDRIPDLVDEVLKLGGVELLWLQLGIQHAEAERKAEASGIRVVSNRCLIIEHQRWFASGS